MVNKGKQDKSVHASSFCPASFPYYSFFSSSSFSTQSTKFRQNKIRTLTTMILTTEGKYEVDEQDKNIEQIKLIEQIEGDKQGE